MKVDRRGFLKIGAGLMALPLAERLKVLEANATPAKTVKTEITHYLLEGKTKKGAGSHWYWNIANAYIKVTLKELTTDTGIITLYETELKSEPTGIGYAAFNNRYHIKANGRLEGKLFLPELYNLKSREGKLGKPDIVEKFSTHWYNYTEANAITEYYELHKKNKKADGVKKHYGKNTVTGIDTGVKDYLSALMDIRFSPAGDQKIIYPYNEEVRDLKVKYGGEVTVKINQGIKKDKYDCLEYSLTLDKSLVGPDGPYDITMFLHNAPDRTPIKVIIDRPGVIARAIYSGSKKSIKKRSSLIP